MKKYSIELTRNQFQAVYQAINDAVLLTDILNAMTYSQWYILRIGYTKFSKKVMENKFSTKKKFKISLAPFESDLIIWMIENAGIVQNKYLQITILEMKKQTDMQQTNFQHIYKTQIFQLM